MAEDFPECEQFDTRKRQICRGEVLTLSKCNAYRATWGLTPLDGNATATPADQQVRTVVAKTTCGKTLLGRPGTAMDRLLRELGIKAPKTCTCRKIMEEMDRLGIADCRANIADLAKKMRDNQGNWEWSRRYSAWASGAWSFATHPELWGVVSPADPFPGLIEIACRRAS